MIYRPLKAKEVLIYAEPGLRPQLAVVLHDCDDDNVVQVRVRGRARGVIRQLLFEDTAAFVRGRRRGDVDHARGVLRETKKRVLDITGKLDALGTIRRELDAREAILRTELEVATLDVADAELRLSKVVEAARAG